MPDVNIWAVLVAAALSFALGGVWYSPAIFGTAWSRANRSDGPQGHPARVFAISFILALAAAFAFAVWLGPAPLLSRAVTSGLAVGVCFVATSFGINYQFAERSPILWCIDGGYHTVQFVLFGVVLGLWH